MDELKQHNIAFIFFVFFSAKVICFREEVEEKENKKKESSMNVPRILSVRVDYMASKKQVHLLPPKNFSLFSETQKKSQPSNHPACNDNADALVGFKVFT